MQPYSKVQGVYVFKIWKKSHGEIQLMKSIIVFPNWLFKRNIYAFLDKVYTATEVIFAHPVLGTIDFFV